MGRESRRYLVEILASLFVETEMIKGHQRRPPLRMRPLSCSEPYPIYLFGDSLRAGLAAFAANPYNRIEFVRSYSPHAVLYSKAAAFVRVPSVSSLVNERSHNLPFRLTREIP